jgi:hypothetical protein
MFRSFTSPASLIWFFGHAVVTFLGMALLTSKLAHGWLGVGISEGIGASLVASGITGLVLFIYIRSSDTLRARLEVFARAGVLDVFPYRSVRIRPEYDRRLATAKQIDLVGYGLSHFRQDYEDNFPQWSQQARVRILLIDPDFPSKNTSLADQRDREERRPVGETRHQVFAFEKAVAEMSGIDPKRFELRRMRAIPAINLLRIDDEIFWGPYLMEQQSRNTPTLLVAQGGFMFEALQAHFEALWREARAS